MTFPFRFTGFLRKQGPLPFIGCTKMKTEMVYDAREQVNEQAFTNVDCAQNEERKRFWGKLNLSFCAETAKMDSSTEYNFSGEDEITLPIKSVSVSSKNIGNLSNLLKCDI